MTHRQADESSREGLRFHRREWRIQRIGWAGMALFISLAVAGLFGSGPLASAHSGTPALGTIDYDRYARYGAETPMRICAPRAASAPPRLHVSIPRQYLEAFEIVSVVPEAHTMAGTPDQVEFVFEISAERSCVAFRLEPTRIGRARGPFTLEGHTPLEVSQFVYP
jgi:hypothetical protein